MNWRTIHGAALSMCTLVVCMPALAAPDKLVIGTADSRIEVKANASGPLLARLSTGACGTGAGEWTNEQSESLPASVEIDGAQVPVHWSHDAALDVKEPRRIVLVYESADPHLRLKWEWQNRAAFGPIEHRITIENLGDKEAWLPMVDSLATAWKTDATERLRKLSIEKGAGSPSAAGIHDDEITEGFHWAGESSTYAHPRPGEAREIIPAELVYSAEGSRCGWYAGIEFSGRTRIALDRTPGAVQSVLGLNPDPGPFKTRLVPKGSFVTPTVFLGAFAGGPDGAGNQLRPWVRAVLGNPLTWKNPQYPLTVNNSWGSGMQVDEKLALSMIHESKELGLEMFHVDAGWFRGVGDWYPDPVKFPHGLAAIADAAHKDGLKFGIWVDWTQAALDTQPGALNVRDPKVRNWLVADVGPNWKPEEFKGQTIDIGVPAAHDWAEREVKRMVESYHLDMIEHDGYLVAQGCTRDDHPHAAPNRSVAKTTHDWGSDFVLANNSTDVSYHAVRAYYDIYEKTRREHPGLLFEICNDGGRMVDFGSAAHGDYFSITDSYDPLSNRRAFFDTSFLLPAAMLESYVEKWPTPRPGNFLYMLRSGMMGWVTIMLDTTAWTPEQHEAARKSIALYKSALRPLIRDARLYHVSERPDGVRWDGVQYWDPARGKGVVFAFRGSTPDEPMHSFALQGLKPAGSYRLHFEDGTSPDRVIDGASLMKQGLPVNLVNPLSSELIFISDAGKGAATKGPGR